MANTNADRVARPKRLPEPLVPSRSLTFETDAGFVASPLLSAEKMVPFGETWGPLTVSPAGVRKGFDCHYRCECGRTGWMRPDKLLQRLHSWIGCGHPRCNAITFDRAVRGSLKVSAKIHHTVFYHFYRDELESDWGGTLDEVHQRSCEQGRRKFVDYALRMPGNTKGERCWIRRRKENGPFMTGNLVLSSRADKALSLGELAKRSIEVDGQAMSVREICAVADIRVGQLAVKLLDFGTSDDLIYNLMTEKENENG